MIPLESAMVTYIAPRIFTDDREASRLFKLAADQGCSQGQRDVGIMCADGRGVPTDDREAVFRHLDIMQGEC
jgi:TPR repeat protein